MRWLCLILLSGVTLQAQTVRGLVQTEDKEPLPYASVYILNSNIGTYADDNGEFDIVGEGQQFILMVSLLGYEGQKIAVDTRHDSFLVVKLVEAEIELQEAVVEGKKENVGKTIMKRVIANKPLVLIENLSYSADSYYRTDMEKWIEKSKKDTVEIEEGFQPVYMNEQFARQHYLEDKSKREVKAELKQNSDNELKRRTRMAVDFGFRGSNLGINYNPLEYFRNPLDANIDLYENQLRNPNLSDLPITSPLSDNAFLTYQFKLVDIQKVEEDSILVIQVTPFFKQTAAFSGQLKIKQSGYLLQEVNLSINASALTLAQNFQLQITYDTIGLNYWRPTQRRIRYQSKLGGNLYQIETFVQESNFDLQPNFAKNFFDNELIVYDLAALERDTAIWQDLRPAAIQLTQKQQTFLSERDSVWRYEQSPEYYRIQDSIYNHNSLLDIAFNGIGWTRRAKGWTLYFNSLLQSAQFFGVGGYRQSLGGTVQKKFANTANILDFRYEINYGFLNEDWKGELETGYTYLPRKFARGFVKVQDMYELITFNTSIQTLLARNNFVRNTGASVGHSFEAWNGVFLTTSLQYADKRPINDLELSEWSNDIFEGDNEPINFERYKALFFRLEALIKFDQQYITRGREKVILGTKYPTLKIGYRKGIPNFFESEVAFDQIELEAYDRTTSKIGSSNWNVQSGSFFNKRNLRVIEHRFFRGATPLFFVDPLGSMQALSTNLSTPNLYVQGGFMHHFDGFILDKVPLLNRLQLELLGGGAFLSIPDQSFTHVEAFAGVGKKFRLFKEQVQVAFYTITTDNSLETAELSYRIGFNFFNAFSGEWLY